MQFMIYQRYSLVVDTQDSSPTLLVVFDLSSIYIANMSKKITPPKFREREYWPPGLLPVKKPLTEERVARILKRFREKDRAENAAAAPAPAMKAMKAVKKEAVKKEA